MGNCIRHESPMMWGGEDWGSQAEDHRIYDEMSEKEMMGIEEKELLLIRDESNSYVTTTTTSNNGNYGTSTSSSNNNSNSNSNNNCNEVKIKISKKQLEELLGKVNVNDMSVQQVLAQFINVGNNDHNDDDDDDYHQSAHQLRSWRPVLQSIPEVN